MPGYDEGKLTMLYDAPVKDMRFLLTHIGKLNELGTTSLYQDLVSDDLVDAIGLPKEKLCTHCWDGSSAYQCAHQARQCSISSASTFSALA